MLCHTFSAFVGTAYADSATLDPSAAQDRKHSKIEDKIEYIIEVLEKVADNRDERDRQQKLEE